MNALTMTTPEFENEDRAGARLVPRQLIATTAGVILAMMAAVAVISYWFGDALLRVSGGFVETFGGFGVALGYFLPDAFTVPLPNDVAAVLGLAGGLSFMEVCAWALLGSMVGGTLGYWIGRYLRTTQWLSKKLQRRGGQAQELLERYGLVALAVAAITPIPYSIFCWTTGAGKLPYLKFFMVSLPLRSLRISSYLYLIQLGLL